MDNTKQKFIKQREELKDWLEGTIGKQYDREETVEVIREDVDRYFSNEWFDQLLFSKEREFVEDLKKMETFNHFCGCYGYRDEAVEKLLAKYSHSQE